MKAVELRDMTLEELMVRESELAEELARMRIQLAIKRLDNPLQVRVTRRELARVKTIIKEKSLSEPAEREESETGKEN